MNTCYLGLGSNLNCPARQLKRALASIQHIPRTVLIKASRVYSSRPLGVRAQPSFCNMAVKIQTALSPQQLLAYCQTIEKKQLRVKKRHWGARTIDIDLLCFEDQTIHTKKLTIPHPELLKRDFVVIPLLEIEPNLQLPNGQPLVLLWSGTERYLWNNMI